MFRGVTADACFALARRTGLAATERFFTDAEESAKYVEIEYRPNGVFRWKATVSVDLDSFSWRCSGLQ
jgi:hypothetical protein